LCFSTLLPPQTLKPTFSNGAFHAASATLHPATKIFPSMALNQKTSSSNYFKKFEKDQPESITKINKNKKNSYIQFPMFGTKFKIKKPSVPNI
jgi:hypothetical protein